MSRFRVLSRAQADLKDIREWIEQDNPPRAASFVAELVEHFGRLAEQPLIGRSRQEMGAGVRSMPHGDFVIFYRPTRTGISVYRVIHGRRDTRRGIQ